MAHVLIVDDEEAFSSGMAEFLRLQGHSAVSTNSLSAARTALRDRMPTVLLLDLMLPDGSGLELLDAFVDRRPERIILCTGHTGVKSLIGNFAGEGVSYMAKPIEPRDLIGVLNSVAEDRAEEDSAHFGLMVGESGPMHELYERIQQVAPTDSTVFVQGESGTGKELVAESIHRLSGRSGRFVPVNCGGLSRELVASQLFGHEKGSFTGANRRHAGFFERAGSGTVFLDEITEMPIDTQAHLLRVLETERFLPVGAEKELGLAARLIAATNRDALEAVGDQHLREDLYFRLQVFPIVVPPLRERVGDIKLLSDWFLRGLNDKYGGEKYLPEQAVQVLERHSWPGNVRELKHVIHRAFISAHGSELQISDNIQNGIVGRVEGLRVGRSIADVEKDLIVRTLEHLDGDKRAAAATLGISLKTLYNRLKEYEM